MRITLEKGHHSFPKPREVFDASGQSLGKQITAAPNQSFDISEKERKEIFTNARARLAEPAAEAEISFDPKVLADKSAKELKVMATKLELEFPNNAGQSKMIEIIIDAAPDDEPSQEWSSERLTAYLEKNEIDFDEESNLLELALDHFNA